MFLLMGVRMAIYGYTGSPVSRLEICLFIIWAALSLAVGLAGLEMYNAHIRRVGGRLTREMILSKIKTMW
jgi:hypothetical protein